MNLLPRAIPFYYFGCIGRAGHYLFAAPGSPRIEYTDTPFRHQIDGRFCPPGAQVQGRAQLTHLEGWTAISYWDRTVDARPGSNSNFLVPAYADFDQMVELATRHFPTVLARLPSPIEQWAAE